MTELGGSPVLNKGGYSKALFVSPPQQIFVCAICDSVFFDPVQSMVCEHGFCRPCILKHIGKHKNCYVCHVALSETQLFPVAMMSTMVKELLTRCSSTFGKTERDVCAWTGPLKNMEDHLLECQHSLVNCSLPGCSVKVMRKELKAHVEKCSFNKGPCDFCDREYLLSDMKAHKSQCGMRLVPCTNFCPATMPYVELEYHLTHHCPKQPVPCPLFSRKKRCGCEGTIEREYLANHLITRQHNQEGTVEVVLEQEATIATLQKDLDELEKLRAEDSMSKDYLTLRFTVERLNMNFCTSDTLSKMILPVPRTHLPFYTLESWVDGEIDPVVDHETVLLLNQQLRTKTDLDGNKAVTAHHIDYEGFFKEFDKPDRDFHLSSLERSILPGIRACVHVERFKDRMIKFYGKLSGYDGDYDCITSLMRIGSGKPFQGSSKVFGGNYQFCKLKTASLFEDGFLSKEDNRIRLLVTFILPAEVSRALLGGNGKDSYKKQKY